MDTKKIALIIGALVIAIGAAFGVNQMMKGATTQQARAAAAPAQTGPSILVATRALPPGTIITADAFRFQPWPKELVERNYYLKDKTDEKSLVGTVVRHQITAGQPLTQGALVHPNDRGFLAAALGPGMRAVTIKVSAEQGVAGFIFPGDRVDLILSQQIKIKEGSSSYPDEELQTAETIVQNLRVLATDQRVVAEDETGKTPVKTYGTVTLEATGEIAEKIAVAQNLGRLSLALRPIADSAAELESAIASGAVSVPANGDAKAESKMLAEARNRPLSTKGSATSGGDVSRFWIPVSGRVSPSSVPRAPAGGGYPSAVVANGGGGDPAAAAAPKGPVVRVSRGGRVTEVPVGGK
jgi:pilus assembly protein CpaB